MTNSLRILRRMERNFLLKQVDDWLEGWQARAAVTRTLRSDYYQDRKRRKALRHANSNPIRRQAD